MCYNVNNNMLQLTKGYIQGAFDGEGHLSKTGHDSREWWVLGFSNSDLVWLQAIARYLTSRGYHPYVQYSGKPGSYGKKPVYSVVLRRRAEIKCYLIEFPPLMAARQKKAAEFFLWDKQHRRAFPKGSDSILQQALNILDESKGQGRFL
jgi:hypothetical protein